MEKSNGGAGRADLVSRSQHSTCEKASTARTAMRPGNGEFFPAENRRRRPAAESPDRALPLSSRRRGNLSIRPFAPGENFPVTCAWRRDDARQQSYNVLLYNGL